MEKKIKVKKNFSLRGVDFLKGDIVVISPKKNSSDPAIRDLMQDLVMEKRGVIELLGKKEKGKEIIDRIVNINKGSEYEPYFTRLDMIEEIDPESGMAKEVMRRVTEIKESSYMLLLAYKQAIKSPERNKVEIADLDWFMKAMLNIAKEIECESSEYKDSDYKKLNSILTNEAKKEVIDRLHNKDEEDPEVAMTINKLLLVLSGELKQALKPFQTKIVSWEVVRNIANSLTNQLLYLGKEVDIEQAHMSDFFQGPVRKFVLEEGKTGNWRSAEWDGQGWHAFDEDDVSELYWESLGSQYTPPGSTIKAIKIKKGEWNICFIPSSKDPTYRGYYFDLYSNPDKVENNIR